MRIGFPAFLLGALLSLAAASTVVPLPWEAPMLLAGEWKFRYGDSAHWAKLDLDDHGWASAEMKPTESMDRQPRRGLTWFRKEVSLAGGVGRLLAVRHQPITPMEIYWDGVLIGRNGRVAAEAGGEAAGNRMLTPIPAGLTGPGRHVLAIRQSSHKGIFKPYPARVALGDLAALELGQFRETLVMFFLAGIFAFAALFRFQNYRASGYGRNAFLFSFSILSVSGYIVMENLCYFVDLGARGYLATHVLSRVCWYFMLSMVPDYFIFAHASPYLWVLPGMLVLGLFVTVPLALVTTGILPFHWLQPVLLANQYLSYLNIGLSIWVISWAVWRRQTGSGLALVGVLTLLALVFVTWEFDVYWAWAAGLAAHIICLTRVQSLQLSERLRRHREDQLRSARLEIELLKKNIQPHFLLNSLNSIIAWLEEEPKTAVLLVNALADEMHMLLKISAEKTIPLAEEINLCRAHLQVMGLRQDKHYSLTYEGVPGNEHVPPLVLHTLVENGITHGYAGMDRGNFLLKREDVPGGVRLSLFNDGKPRENPGKPGEGTGLRYVRSRLEEAFPGRWNLESRQVGDGWQVVLDLLHAGAPAGKAAHEGAYRRG